MPGRFSRFSLTWRLPALCLLAAALSRPGAAQETGVFEDYILFGQSAAFSGDVRKLGQALRLGLEAAFQESWDKGGVHGREIRLHSYDDSYEPENAIANTRKLIEEDQVFALIGSLGTSTSRSAVPIAAAARVPYIAPFTGADFLRDPRWGNVINLRASYAQESDMMVRYLLRRNLRRIAVFYQDDSFGRVGYQGVVRALERRGSQPIAFNFYPRKTRAVKTGLLELQRAAPDAVIMIGGYRSVAAAYAWSRKIGFTPMFLTLSFVGGNALAKELGPQGAGIFVSQVVPSPWQREPRVLGQFRAALSAYAADAAPGFVSLEGYLAGRLILHALEKVGPQVDRESFLAALKKMDKANLGGFPLSFSDGNQGSNTVFLTRLDPNGRYSMITRSSWKPKPGTP